MIGDLFVGAAIHASNELCRVTAQARNGYYGCKDPAPDRQASSSLPTMLQGQKMIACAKRVQDHQRFPIS
jgi:hypothetical protein